MDTEWFVERVHFLRVFYVLYASIYTICIYIYSVCILYYYSIIVLFIITLHIILHIIF